MIRNTALKAHITLLASILVSASTSLAQSVIQLDIEAPFEPVAGVGLIISTDGTTSARQASSIKSRGENQYILEFPFERRELREDFMISGLLKSSDGQIALADVKPAMIEISQSLYSLPDCPVTETKLPPGISSQIALLESLVEIRTDRREKFFKSSIKEVLNEDFAQQLNDLEKAFGLKSHKAISAELHPVEMTDRLSRIKAAIEQYRRE